MSSASLRLMVWRGMVEILGTFAKADIRMCADESNTRGLPDGGPGGDYDERCMRNECKDGQEPP